MACREIIKKNICKRIFLSKKFLFLKKKKKVQYAVIPLAGCLIFINC